ncbi:MAG: hypothetical protein OER86_09530, partial [Phycisphaerae bacterium]|nr:hypothetical protein [Phycisphaerae bacterium]
MSSVPASQLYTEINFVPGWYVQAKRQDLSLRRQAIMLVVMAGLLSWLIYRAVDTRAETKLYLNTLQERLESTERRSMRSP